MSYDIGFNFRASDTYVTDPANTTYSIGEAYPTTRSMVTSGLSVTFGWDVDWTSGGRDRDNGIDARLAGMVVVNSAAVSERTFQIDLPASGTYAVNLAAGDPLGAQNAHWELKDSNNTTVLLSQSLAAGTTAYWRDATGVNRTSAADWVSNNASANVTFSGTTAYLRLIGESPASIISHLRLYQASSGATISTITGTTVTEASSVVFTTTMSGTGGGTFAYSWSGTATSADYTSTLTTGMCAVTGGSGSVTVSGSNITVDSTVTAFTVTVPTTTDTLDEADETIRLVIGGVTSSSGTITDDDTQPTCTISDATEVAGTVTFVATLSAASGRSLSFDYATADGTKTAGVDYTAASGTVTFAAGETTKDIVITAL